MQELHIRIDQTDTFGFQDIDNYLVNKFNPTKYIICEEISKSVKKLHYHVYIQYESTLDIKSNQIAIRRHFGKVHPGGGQLNSDQYCVQLIQKTVQHLLVYITKDLNIKNRINISDAYLEQVLQETQEVENDKKRAVKDKLLTRYIKMEYPTNHTRYQVIHFILDQYREWEALPPTKSLMDQYVVYILLQTSNYTTDEIQIMMYL